MSVQAMTWALEQQVVTDAAMRHVLLCLANYANEAGKGAFPSIATLSSDTGLSERTVQYKLRSLEEAGVIRRGNQAIAAAYISHRDRLPMVYDLSMERGAPVAPGADDNVTGCKPRRNGVQRLHPIRHLTTKEPPKNLKSMSKPAKPVRTTWVIGRENPSLGNGRPSPILWMVSRSFTRPTQSTRIERRRRRLGGRSTLLCTL